MAQRKITPRQLDNTGVVAGDYGDATHVAEIVVNAEGQITGVTEVLITGGAVRVKEIDGSPNVSPVTTIRVSNGTLSDDGGGQVTITTGGGGGGISNVPIQIDAGGVGNATTIKFAQGGGISIDGTDLGSGVIRVKFTDSGTVTFPVDADVIGKDDSKMVVDTTSGNVTMTLPALNLAKAGHILYFKKIVAANSMIVQVNGGDGETIDGSSSKTVILQYGTLQVFHDGSNWWTV